MKKILSIVTMFLIICLGAILSGCALDYSSLSLSLKEAQQIELSVTDEKVDYIIVITGDYSFNPQFNFAFDKQVAKVVEGSVEDKGEGEYKFSIAPIYADSANLTITLKGTNKQVTVPVVVRKELESITPISTEHVLCGGSLVLSSTMFEFSPSGTTQNALSFALSESDGVNYEQNGVTLNAQTNTLTVASTCTLNSINVVATSMVNANKKATLRVDVVQPVDVSQFTLQVASQSQTNAGAFDGYVTNALQAGTMNFADALNLVTSDAFNFQKKLKIEYAQFNSNYAVEISTTARGVYFGEENTTKLTKTQNFELIVSANEVVSGEIIFKIYSLDLPQSYKELHLAVNVICEPRGISINGQLSVGLVELFTNDTEFKTFQFGVTPDKASKNDYNYTITYAEGNYDQNEFGTPTTTAPSSFEIQYGGVALTGNSLGTLDAKLALRARSEEFVQIGKDYKIIISCVDKQDATKVICSVEMFVKVYVGPYDFGIEGKYVDPDTLVGTIYLAMPNGNEDASMEFDGFTYTEGAYLGQLTATSEVTSEPICTINQKASASKPTLIITPKHVGEQRFIITTSNNKSTVLKVIVFRQILQDDFSVEIADIANNDISSFTQNGSMLTGVVLKGKNTSVNLGCSVRQYTDTNNYSFTYNLELKAGGTEYFSISNNSKITSKKFTEKGASVPLCVKLTINTVEDFALKATNVEFVVNLQCINYIKELSLYSSNSETGDVKSKTISIYNKIDLSYINQNLANMYLFMDLVQQEQAPFEGLSINNFKFYSGNEEFTLKQVEGQDYYEVGEIGYFYPDANMGALQNGYLGKFTYNFNSLRTLSEISVKLEITDPNTNQPFSSSAGAKIEKYIEVESIWLSAPEDVIYLDNTQTYHQKSISIQILPANAMCKDLEIMVDTTSANCIGFEILNNTITFTYRSAGEGDIYIFPVSKMKTHSYTDSFGEYYYHRKISFRCADGLTEATALKISSVQDLKSVIKDRHYYIDDTIDCTGQTIEIAEFQGTIRGTFYDELNENFATSQQTGSIINLKVAPNATNSMGFINKLLSGGKIYNLTIGACFSNEYILKDQTSYIGLLCGINQGTIKNVNVVISAGGTTTIKNTLDEGREVYTGILAGKNEGTICVQTQNLKNSTLLVDTNNYPLSVVFDGRLTSYFGGIVGYNAQDATINQNIDANTHISVGLYGTTANVVCSSNASRHAGAVGYNKGTISGLKVVGTISGYINSETSTAEHVAGFVGITNNGIITNNISRVFVRGYQNVAGFVGIIDNISGASTSITGNKVQAIDDGTKTGIDISLIIGYSNASKVYPIFDTLNSKAGLDLNSTNVATESYVERLLPATVKSKITNMGVTYSGSFAGEFTDESNVPSYDNSLSIEYYYGEIIRVSENIDNNIYYINDKTAYQKGQEDEIITTNMLTNFVLFAYLQAQNSSSQAYISNMLDSVSLLTCANIITIDGEGNITSALKEVNLNILSPQVARTENYGKNILLLGVGELTIKVSSSLNYKRFVNLNLHIENYYSNIKVYADKDKTQEITEVELVNKQTNTVFFRLYSEPYDYKNTPITLTENTSATFNVDPVTNVSIFVQQQASFLNVNQDDIPSFEAKAYYITKYVLNQEEYFNAKIKVKTANNNISALMFIKEADFAKCGVNNANIEQKELSIKATTAIQNITLNKSYLEVEPSDTVDVTLSYETHNTSDEIVPMLRVYTGANTYDEYHYNRGKFVKNDDTLFVLTCQDMPTVGNKHTQQYSLKMPIDSEFSYDIYNYLKGKTVELIFSSKLAPSQMASIVIKYKPESISSVLVDNYSKDANLGMIETQNGINKINANKMLYTSQQISTGELNVLNAYVYTGLSEFDYVDISINSNIEGAFMAYINYETVDGKVIGTVSNFSVYVSLENGGVLRVYKKYITEDPINNILPIGVMYKIPTSVPDGTYIPITFNFVRDGQTIFTQSVELVSKLADQVSFEIQNKRPIYEQDDVKTYNVARGVKYLLSTTIVGYADQEIIFESSNPNIAKVVKYGTEYYLEITDTTMQYTEDTPYFEVNILSYGQRQYNHQVVRSAIKTTKLHIYDLIVNDYDLYNTNELNIRVLETVDIKELVADQIKYEYSRLTGYTTSDFKQTFLKNAKFYLVEQDGTRFELKNGVERKVDNLYQIECFTTQSNKLEYRLTALSAGVPCTYTIEVEHKIAYKKGVPEAVAFDQEDTNVYLQSFTLTAIIPSTKDNPIPINTFKEMQEMVDGEYYRQVQDIKIKASEFQMITSKPKLFDGNGYNITITAGDVYMELDASSNFALFKKLENNSIIKNVSIVIAGSLNLTLNNNSIANGANIAILVAENEGIITNCSVKSSSMVNVNIMSTVSVMERSYFAGICSKNSGYITNCQVECSLTASGASLGGVVAQNEGSISSTYIKNSRIYNTTSTTSENITTGGFVCKNSGSIKMSYVEGSATSSRIYCDFVEGDYTLNSKIIYTSTKVAGFVYENTGEISDCYSNIPIVSSNESSGFVANAKDGKIERTFSLCKLKQQDTLNYGFVANYERLQNMFVDCFFVIQNGIINYNTSHTNYGYDGSAYTSVINGVTPLTIGDFNIVDADGKVKSNNKFASFIAEQESISGVWFYVYDAEKELSFSNITYTNDVPEFALNGNAQSFTARRLQLVAPNLKAYSKFDLILGQDTEGNAQYAYTLSKDAGIVGSKTNPHVISSASEFEQVLGATSGYEYYRLVADIDYLSEDIFNSNLYTKTLTGYFDGNGFKVANYSVNNIISNMSAGLFANMGSSNAMATCLKNTTFKPAYINLPNCIYVGSIAGSLTNASVYNVRVDAPNVTTAGANVVGGMFGRTYGINNLVMIYSNISTKASFYSSNALATKLNAKDLSDVITYKETGANKTRVSYAGGIIGHVGGVTNIINASIGDGTKVLGMTSGLMFGGVGALATISNFNLQLDSFNQSIVAYAFGGYVAGELFGKVTNFAINSTIFNQDLINCYPIAPMSFGGVAGYAYGAEITNFSSTDGYAIIGAKILGKNANNYLTVYNPYLVKYLGGVIGYAQEITVDNVSIKGNTSQNEIGLALMGGNYVGGIAGYLEGKLVDSTGIVNETAEQNKYIDSKITNVNINLIGSKTYTNKDKEQVTDKLYMSYVSEAVGDSRKDGTNLDQFVGLVYGFGLSKQSTQGNRAQDLYNIYPSNSTITANGVEVFFAKYFGQRAQYDDFLNECNAHVKNMFNFNGCSSSSQVLNAIKVYINNLTDGKTYNDTLSNSGVV